MIIANNVQLLRSNRLSSVIDQMHDKIIDFQVTKGKGTTFFIVIRGTLLTFGALVETSELMLFTSTLIASTRLKNSRFLYFFFNFYDA